MYTAFEERTFWWLAIVLDDITSTGTFTLASEHFPRDRGGGGEGGGHCRRHCNHSRDSVIKMILRNKSDPAHKLMIQIHNATMGGIILHPGVGGFIT